MHGWPNNSRERSSALEQSKSRPARSLPPRHQSTRRRSLSAKPCTRRQKRRNRTPEPSLLGLADHPRSWRQSKFVKILGATDLFQKVGQVVSFGECGQL